MDVLNRANKKRSGNSSLKDSKTEYPISGVKRNILSSFLANSINVFTNVVLNCFPLSLLMQFLIVLYLVIYNAIPVYLP